MPDYRPRLIFDIFLVNLPFPSLSEFLRLDELCPRTRNNYQSPFLPLPVKNRRKEARRGKKGETIVGERKETKRLTFTLPSRTKFPPPSFDFVHRFLPISWQPRHPLVIHAALS